jgi:hypothetical protein
MDLSISLARGIFAGTEIEGWLSIAWNRRGRMPEDSTPRRRFSLTPFGILSSLGWLAPDRGSPLVNKSLMTSLLWVSLIYAPSAMIFRGEKPG